MSFTIISKREIPTWVEIFAQDGVDDPNEILRELKLIDDLLILMKSQSLLNKKRNLKTQLEARIGHELGHKTKNLNIKGK